MSEFVDPIYGTDRREITPESPMSDAWFVGGPPADYLHPKSIEETEKILKVAREVIADTNQLVEEHNEKIRSGSYEEDGSFM